MRCERTPYVIAPTRAASDPRLKRIVVVMFSQGGKTNILFNIAGHRLDDRPVPVLYIGPTRSNINNVIEPKIDFLLQTCKSLWEKTVKGKSYTRTKKIIAGVSLRFAWAGSPTELASDSACIVLVDEPDRMESDIGGEGSIWNLADARHGSFLEGKTIGVSTPTEGNIETYKHKDTGLTHWAVADHESVVSSIWRAWQIGSRFEWAWPCPSCREYFIPRFINLWWPSGATAVEAEDEGRLVCPHCENHIATTHKDWMNARGCYVAPGQRPLKYREGDNGVYMLDFTGVSKPNTKNIRRNSKHVTFIAWGDYLMPAGSRTAHATFWASGIASYQPKKTFGALCAEWIVASESRDEDTIKGVLNLQFGECFKFGGEAPEWQQVLLCAGDYETGTIPEGVVLLTCGVDVGKTRIYFCVRGWREDGTSFLIDWEELQGDTQRTEIWDKLQHALDTDYNGHHIFNALIDSGYRRDEVYAFCRRPENRQRCFPTKGAITTQKPFWSSLQDVRANGKLIKRGVTLWNFDSDVFKSWVHGRITWSPEQPGAWLLPRNITEEYCRQIINEQRLVTPAGRIMWKRMGANHYLDCEALNALAVRRLGKIRSKTKETSITKRERAQPRNPRVNDERTQRSNWIRRGGGWMNR